MAGSSATGRTTKEFKSSLQSLREIGRAAANAVRGCLERLAKPLAQDEAVPEELEMQQTASAFLQLPTDAKPAVERVFPESGPPKGGS